MRKLLTAALLLLTLHTYSQAYIASGLDNEMGRVFVDFGLEVPMYENSFFLLKARKVPTGFKTDFLVGLTAYETRDFELSVLTGLSMNDEDRSNNNFIQAVLGARAGIQMYEGIQVIVPVQYDLQNSTGQLYYGAGILLK